jgi:hypothetical protein
VVAKEILRGDFVSFSSFLLWPALTLTHYFTYHSFFILVRPERAVTYRYPLITDIPKTHNEKHHLETTTTSHLTLKLHHVGEQGTDDRFELQR